MRTTLDLPDNVLAVVRHLAHASQRSMGSVAAELIQRGLDAPSQTPPPVSDLGLPTVSVGRPITPEDVAALEDE